MISSTNDAIHRPSNVVVITRIGTNDSLPLAGDEGSQ